MGNDQDFAIKNPKTKGMTFSATPFNFIFYQRMHPTTLAGRITARPPPTRRLPQRTAAKRYPIYRPPSPAIATSGFSRLYKPDMQKNEVTS